MSSVVSVVDGARSTLARFAAVVFSVPDNVVVSPSSAGGISGATTTPMSRSTACSVLYARCVVPSFILAIFASGSVLLTQSALDSFLPLGERDRRQRRRNPALLGHALQHFPGGLACLPADDR